MSDFSTKEEWLESLSNEEKRAAEKMLNLCEDIRYIEFLIFIWEF